ncbi:MAG: hypothetical protein ABIJ27_03725 [Candidatus Omnitrophota bacterium]
MVKLPLTGLLSKLSKRETYILYVGVVLVVLLSIERAILSPVLMKQKKLDREIMLQEELIKRSAIVFAHKDRLKKDAEEYGRYLSKTESEEKETNTFLTEIERLAKENKIFLASVRPAGMEKGTAIRRYRMALELEANMASLFAFFYEVETAELLIAIDQFNIRPKSDKSSIVTATVNISKVIVPKE